MCGANKALSNPERTCRDWELSDEGVSGPLNVKGKRTVEGKEAFSEDSSSGSEHHY